MAMLEYLNVTNSITTMKSVLDNMMTMQGQNIRQNRTNLEQKKEEVILNEIQSFYRNTYLNEEFLIELYMPSFKKRFSLSELNEVIDFYRTSTGKKLANYQPDIQKETMSSFQQHLIKNEAQLQNSIVTRLKSEGL